MESKGRPGILRGSQGILGGPREQGIPQNYRRERNQPRVPQLRRFSRRRGSSAQVQRGICARRLQVRNQEPDDMLRRGVAQAGRALRSSLVPSPCARAFFFFCLPRKWLPFEPKEPPVTPIRRSETKWRIETIGISIIVCYNWSRIHQLWRMAHQQCF